MSKLPIDVVNFADEFEFDLQTAITIANSIQEQFVFNSVDKIITQKFKLVHCEENDCDEFLENALEIKNELAGYYPYILFVSQNPLNGGGWSNLFANHNSEQGVGIITTDNVPDIIIPKDKISAYFVYYFARTLIKFLLIGKYNHNKASKKDVCLISCDTKKTYLKV